MNEIKASPEYEYRESLLNKTFAMVGEKIVEVFNKCMEKHYDDIDYDEEYFLAFESTSGNEVIIHITKSVMQLRVDWQEEALGIVILSDDELTLKIVNDRNCKNSEIVPNDMNFAVDRLVKIALSSA